MIWMKQTTDFQCKKVGMDGTGRNQELFLPEKFLGGGFKHFLFLPLPGEMIQFD